LQPKPVLTAAEAVARIPDGATVAIGGAGAGHALPDLLLRALENGEVQPVGSVRRETVDVRVITATDADLEQAIAGGRFRGPLYYRLAGYLIRLPPLRERRDDLGRLLYHFLDRELGELGGLPGETGERPWPPAEVVARLALHWSRAHEQIRRSADRFPYRHVRTERLRDELDGLRDVTGLLPDLVDTGGPVRVPITWPHWIKSNPGVRSQAEAGPQIELRSPGVESWPRELETVGRRLERLPPMATTARALGYR